jgi:molybdopterin-guanine dinucleotide biosynthesis protein B
MIPIVSIVGTSDSGKTTLLERLIPALTKRGYRVVTVKHDVHGFEVDREGKDSWRHRKAGSSTTIISSPEKIAIISDTDRDMTLEEIRGRYIQDADVIISEGYKRESYPKVEVSRKVQNRELLCTEDENLIAVATDYPVKVNVPRVDINDAEGLADIIEEKVINGYRPERISLLVNGKPVPLKPFIEVFLTNSILGSLSALKGCQKAEDITIRIKTKKSKGRR